MLHLFNPPVDDEAAAKVLHVENAAEQLLQEQRANFEQELATYLAQAQAGHEILKRQIGPVSVSYRFALLSPWYGSMVAF